MMLPSEFVGRHLAARKREWRSRWFPLQRNDTDENARLLGEQGRAWAALAYLLPHEENTP